MAGKRIIQLDKPISKTEAGESVVKSLKRRSVGDYQNVSASYLRLVKSYSNPLLAGPPVCDELVALVQHMFTPEEANIAQYISTPLGKTAAKVADLAHIPVDEARAILDRLTHEKGILLYWEKEENKRYRLMPLLPGVFEMTMMRTTAVDHVPVVAAAAMH